ncbi:hypothetical protein GOODEAATRI_033505, partial [Goodea atripinnis]
SDPDVLRTFKQLQQIITSRLNKVKAFEEDALQLVSRKVSVPPPPHLFLIPSGCQNQITQRSSALLRQVAALSESDGDLRALGHRPPVSVSAGLAVCHRLGACRLLLLEPSRLGVLQRVRLNVSEDDVLFALKAD